MRSALAVPNPGGQMEELFRRYRLSSDKALFAQALIGNLVSERAARLASAPRT